MKSFLFKTINDNSGSELILEAFHDSNLNNRKGYDPVFLGTEVKLPKVFSESLKMSIAQNHEPGPSGQDYLDYTNFTVMFNKDKKLPFFTVVNIIGKSDEIAGEHDSRGSDSWFCDNRIQESGDNFQFTNNDYKDSGFQKGHMVRFYDPAWGESEEQKKIAIGDTFHYTNCCPQLGKYNAGIWNDLEDYYMARAIFQDRKVIVFTGPIFNKAKKIGNLLVPVNFWKIIVYKNNGKLQALAFLISHEIALNKLLEEGFIIEPKKVKPTLKQSDIDRLFNLKNLKKWIVKIELIEKKTGLRFNLNQFDRNKSKPEYFNISESEFDPEFKRAKILTEAKLFTMNLNSQEDTEFIKNI